MEEKLLDILEEICGDEIVKENRDINLNDEDLMDSLDYTELLIAIEENFDVVIAPSEVTREGHSQQDYQRREVKDVATGKVENAGARRHRRCILRAGKQRAAFGNFIENCKGD